MASESGAPGTDRTHLPAPGPDGAASAEPVAPADPAADLPDATAASADSERVGLTARAVTYVAAERRRVGRTVDRLRDTSTFVDSLAHAWEYDSEIGGGLMAGALAFRLFMFMVPLTLFGFTLTAELADILNMPPRDFTQRAGIGGVLAHGVVNVATMSTTSRLVLLVITAYATVWASRNVIRTIIDAYCLIWRIPRLRTKRTKAGLVLIGFVIVYSTLASLLGRLRAVAPAPGIALTIAAIVVPLLAWFWASWVLPHDDAPVWALIPGTVVFAVGIECIHLFTVFYVSKEVTAKSETYGVIGVSLAVLFWAYICGRLVTGTAVVNAVLWRRFEETHPDEIAEARDDEASARSRTRLAIVWLRSVAGLFR